MTEVSGGEKRNEVYLASRPVSYLLPRLVSPALILGGAVYLAATDSRDRDHPFGVVLLIVMALALMVLPIHLFLKARGQPWAVCIGPDGVTWHDSKGHLAWSMVAEVRVGPRGRLRARRRASVRLIDLREADFGARAASRPVGHLIDTRHLTANSEEVLTAIAQFATLPTVRE